jgi:hypothetical protein
MLRLLTESLPTLMFKVGMPDNSPSRLRIEYCLWSRSPISASLLAAGLVPRHARVSGPGGRLRGPRIGSLTVRETRPLSEMVKNCGRR